MDNELDELTKKYESLLISYNELQEKCSNELIELRLKNDDNEKKLKLSNQAYEYLEKSLLDIKQESITIEKNNIVSFIFIGLIIILLLFFVIKKISHKNKF